MHTANSWAARPASRLIVVLSSERSGSTLLRVMLGEHSRIIAPQELFLLRYPDFDTWRARKPEALESLLEILLLLGRPIPDAAIQTACRGRATIEVYQWLFEFLSPGNFLIDKTPAYANDPMALARSAALDPFYVWLIRHPLGVIDSHVRLKQRERRTRPLPRRILRPLRDAVERLVAGMTDVARQRETKWVLQNLNLRTFMQRVPPAQRAIVHFEDLVRAPERVLDELCSAIGIEPEPGMLRPDTVQRMNPQLGDPNFHLRTGIEAVPADDWRSRYDETQLRAETVRLMRQIGVRSVEEPRSHAA